MKYDVDFSFPRSCGVSQAVNALECLLALGTLLFVQNTQRSTSPELGGGGVEDDGDDDGLHGSA